MASYCENCRATNRASKFYSDHDNNIQKPSNIKTDRERGAPNDGITYTKLENQSYSMKSVIRTEPLSETRRSRIFGLKYVSRIPSPVAEKIDPYITCPLCRYDCRINGYVAVAPVETNEGKGDGGIVPPYPRLPDFHFTSPLADESWPYTTSPPRRTNQREHDDRLETNTIQANLLTTDALKRHNLRSTLEGITKMISESVAGTASTASAFEGPCTWMSDETPEASEPYGCNANLNLEPAKLTLPKGSDMGFMQSFKRQNTEVSDECWKKVDIAEDMAKDYVVDNRDPNPDHFKVENKDRMDLECNQDPTVTGDHSNLMEMVDNVDLTNDTGSPRDEHHLLCFTNNGRYDTPGSMDFDEDFML